MAKRKTLSDLLETDRPVIPGTWVAHVMNMDSTRLFGYARDDPDKIQFAYQLSGNRVKVPRIPFLKFLGITDEEIKNKKQSSADKGEAPAELNGKGGFCEP